MKDRPILFTGSMVRAILDGTKTQTRRVVKYIPMLGEPAAWCAAAVAQEPGWVHIVGDYRRFCPYGQPGDRIWVRETFKSLAYGRDFGAEFHFKADGYDPATNWEKREFCRKIIPQCDDKWRPMTFGKWRPSIFLPRFASRITLEIVKVRVERVQRITEADAEAEGIQFMRDIPDADETLSARKLYEYLWDSINLTPKPNYAKINGKKQIVSYQCHPWSNQNVDAEYTDVRDSGLHREKPITVISNPWVWVVEFKKI